MSKELTDKIFELTAGIIAEEGCELIEAELVQDGGRKILRLYIDKVGGVELGDCAKVSHAVEDLLEVEGVMPSRYDLEVSSPGINRPLRLKKHFEKVVGQKVVVIATEKINNRKHHKGILKEVSDDQVVIEIDNQNFNVSFKLIARANLVVSKA